VLSAYSANSAVQAAFVILPKIIYIIPTIFPKEIMVQQIKWTDRKFTYDFPVGVFPCILERFRGTPARLEEIVKSLSPTTCTTRAGDGWSIQEHAGHLLDLEDLNMTRIGDFQAKKEALTAADITNRKTFEAFHNANSMQNILAEFRRKRTTLVLKLEQFNEEEASRTALHPRLRTPMRVIDWLYFMCEHDDHHLARMRHLITTL
jgi:hypothetical protein